MLGISKKQRLPVVHNCVLDSKNHQLCGKKKDIDAGKKESSVSHVNNSTLSPNGLCKNLKRTKADLRAMTMKVVRLEVKLKVTDPTEQQMIPLVNGDMRGVVKSAYDHIRNGEENNFKAKIIKNID